MLAVLALTVENVHRNGSCGINGVTKDNSG